MTQKLDLVFLIDATSSHAMRSVIAALPEKIEGMIIESWRKAPVGENQHVDFRLRVIGYRDRDFDGEAWLIDNPFVTHLAHFKAQLAALESVGGGDEPASLLDAMYVVSQWPKAVRDIDPTWGEWRHRSDAQRALMIITDSSCKPYFTAEGGTAGTIYDIVQIFASEQIVVNLLAPEFEQYHELIMLDESEWEPIGSVETAAAAMGAWIASNQCDRSIERMMHRLSRRWYRARAIYEPISEYSASDLAAPPAPLPDPNEVLASAIANAEQLLARREEAYGPDHSLTANSLESLANLLKIKGDYPAAEPLLRRVLKIQELHEGPAHAFTAASLANLAGVLTKTAAFDEAEELYRRALLICEQLFGSDDFNTNAVVSELAASLEGKGDKDSAAMLYLRLLASRENTFGSDDARTGEAKSLLAGLYDQMGRSEEAAHLRLPTRA
jgi:tetratricopeptide (TPR) repeat protein